MKKFIKTLFVFIVYLSLLPQSASANAPIPEYGKARGTIDIPCVLPPPAWRYPGEKEGAMITHTITIDFWNGGTSNIPVLTPEVFSKYNWGGFEPEKIPTIEGGEYQVETFGSTRFNGLYGQVEFI